ncbi:uncharacterized protein LOC111643414, partial [Copidosoma floridanum]|uniref:uncharacterized protein LOC111643414 n=1 Tax=Copidosoma floridanum TaxID=29053 RepID=UPI000C6FA629
MPDGNKMEIENVQKKRYNRIESTDDEDDDKQKIIETATKSKNESIDGTLDATQSDEIRTRFKGVERAISPDGSGVDYKFLKKFTVVTDKVEILMRFLSQTTTIRESVWSTFVKSDGCSRFIKNLLRHFYTEKEIARLCLTKTRECGTSSGSRREVIPDDTVNCLKECLTWFATHKTSLTEAKKAEAIKNMNKFITEEINYQIKE